MDLFSFDTPVTIAVFGAICAGLGYLYKSRKEKKENLKSALYLLLEIWHRMTILAKSDFEKEFEALIGELGNKIPETKISPEEANAFKNYLSPILLNTLHQIALEGYDSFEDAFNAAVISISKDDPVFAYQVNSSSNIKDFIASIDTYLQNALPGGDGNEHNEQFAQLISKKMKEKVKIESLKDLERDMVLLSRRIGLISEVKVRRLIYKRKQKLSKSAEDELPDLINEILIPTITEFNKQMQPTANASASDL